ncbi:alpha/beta hydrolase [Bacillaceae bacterium JMAK1]|nr:alpha/beta hydrolase [Bacillaceae bacterium JMAK1]
MPYANMKDVQLYYEVYGEGDPIVFTHGASWDHQQWRPQVEHFSQGYKVIVWDVRGHGKSSLPAGEVHSDELVRDLVGLLEYLEIEQAHLCGLSMGGHISLQVAIQYPERVKSLILIGTPYTNTYNWFEKLFVPINRFSSRLIPMRLLAKIQARTLSTFNKDNKAYILDVVPAMKLNDWVRLWSAVSRMESGDQLAEVKCPTLIVQGDHDQMIKRQQADLARQLSNARLITIKNAHHATNLDNAIDVNEAIGLHVKEYN